MPHDKSKKQGASAPPEGTTSHKKMRRVAKCEDTCSSCLIAECDAPELPQHTKHICKECRIELQASLRLQLLDDGEKLRSLIHQFVEKYGDDIIAKMVTWYVAEAIQKKEDEEERRMKATSSGSQTMANESYDENKKEPNVSDKKPTDEEK